MFAIRCGQDAQNLNYWSDKSKKEYKLERSAVATAIKIREQQQLITEVVDESTGKTVRIIVAKDGVIYASNPRDWERLNSEGFTR